MTARKNILKGIFAVAFLLALATLGIESSTKLDPYIPDSAAGLVIIMTFPIMFVLALLFAFQRKKTSDE